MRDDKWLDEKLELIWGSLFPDTERANNVIIKFKGKWKNKFGHIKRLSNKDTEIAINSLFKHEQVPEFIIDLTVIHELVHYSHGFHSPLPKLHDHPHKHGIVTKELKKLGYSHLIKEERKFVREEWLKIYNELNPKKKRSLFYYFR